MNSVHEMIDNRQMPFGEEIFASSTNFQSFRASHYRLLMENLGILEKTFSDSEALRLEKDIISQLGKLGALEFFYTRLSGSLDTSHFLDSSDFPEQVEERQTNSKVDDHLGKVVVRSGRKKEYKSRRKRALASTEVLAQSLPSKSIEEGPSRLPASSVKRASNYKSRGTMVAKKEAEMSKAVKVSLLSRE